MPENRYRDVRPARRKAADDAAEARKKRRGAKVQAAGGRSFNVFTWLSRHGQACLFSLGRLARTPGGTLLTVTAIGIALALPAGLNVLVQNASSLSSRWDSAAEIALYLDRSVTDTQAAQMIEGVRQRSGVASAVLITREQALAEFRASSEFGAALDLLDDNPLPAVIMVQPADVSPPALDRLLQSLQAITLVEQAKLDREWLQRLQAVLQLIKRGLMIIFIMLGVAVAVVVGNTIRLDIQSRRKEIQVMKLVGGSDAFIRRPFLYSGFWYGLAGGLFAVILITGTILLMGGPFKDMIALFGSSYRLQGLGATGSLQLLLAGALFGWLGSWLAVGRHLKDIEPV